MHLHSGHLLQSREVSCIVFKYPGEEMKGHGAAFCQLPQVLLHSTLSRDPSEQLSQHHRHFISKASALTPEHTSSALLTDHDCTPAFSPQHDPQSPPPSSRGPPHTSGPRPASPRVMTIAHPGGSVQVNLRSC